jgi:peptidoglycan hydrolase FlgJ
MASLAFTPQLSADATAALAGAKGSPLKSRTAEQSEATRGAGAAWPLPSVASAGRAAKARGQAEDFEAMFLNSMFQQMFDGVGQGPFSGGPGATIWRSFLTDEYSKSFVKKGGIGLANEVERALLAQQEIR